MKQILLIDHADSSRQWIATLLQRLEAAGYATGVSLLAAPTGEIATLDRLLALEARRFGPCLASRRGVLGEAALDRPDLVIDLTGESRAQAVPVLTLKFCGHAQLEAGIEGVFGSPPQPELTTLLDGVPIGYARPMLDDRVWLSRMANNLLAAAITLTLQSVARFFAGTATPLPQAPSSPAPSGKLRQLYFGNFMRGLGRRLGNRLLRRKPFYWQVAYRVIEGPGVAETARLDGPPFAILPDDGLRFYADPFLFEQDGKTYLFVEEFPYSTGKGIVSVAQWEASGRFGTPFPVLEAPHHLSYPQVFSDGGDIFMLPESSGGHELVLYRAVDFPDRWERDTVLLAGREINDATLLRTDGRYWLFCSERLPQGSASDTLVIFHAEALHGPWIEHAANPIAIDRRGARPGGAFIDDGEGSLTLPVQDGTWAYGGGLGLMTVTDIDAGAVTLGEPRPIAPGPAWDRRGIHTLNRLGSIEVVDSAG